MADFPFSTPVDFDAGGALSTMTALLGLSAQAGASTAWPSANLAIFVPVRVPAPVTVYQLVIGAGATAAGNFDVGIYDSAGNRLVSSGATAKGSNTDHVINVAATRIGPGVYYLALSADGTNNYILITPSGTSTVPLQKTRLYGVMGAASSYVLPATVTFAAASSSLIPLIAAYTRKNP